MKIGRQRAEASVSLPWWQSHSLLFLLTLLLFSTGYVEAADQAVSAGVGAVSTQMAKSDSAPPKVSKTFDSMSKESATCASCHAKENPGLYQQWGRSKHYGANVGCYECHQADKSDPDAIRHKDFMISVIVSPKDCAECHAQEVKEFDNSHHATGGLILGSLDNVLAEVVEGFQGKMGVNGESAAAVQGCWQCHGSPVKVNPDGKLDASTWPNTGIGRLNPDGSKGSCAACHQRHSFSAKQARQPETCGKCHLGPDHPQKEIYEESKHGISYYTNMDQMNLDSAKWIPGQDYDVAPTCATCHMSATADLPITHDIGDRISWTLRPPVSVKVDETKAANKKKAAGKEVKNWIDRRKDMKNVCRSCHGVNWVENWYEQFDGVVHTYNEKFALPGRDIMKALLEAGLRTKIPFDDKIEWTWFYLWHHEGRRVRHGAAMQAPDYVQWHGFYEVAERFYMELIPEARELAHEDKEKGAKVEKLIDEILNRPEHRWILGKRPSEEIAKKKAAQAEFLKRYQQH